MATTKETAAEAAAREAREGFPAWFDAAKHRATGFGITEIATGVLLGDDGQPRFASDRFAAEGASRAQSEQKGNGDAAE